MGELSFSGTASVRASLEVAGESLDVLSYELSEALFEVSSLQVRAVKHDQPLPDPLSLVGKDARFALEGSEGGQRVFPGLVVEASTEQAGDDLQALLLRIAPSLWRLGKRRDCRIFQQSSVVDVAKQVLSGAGVQADEQDWKVTEPHPPRTTVAQYRESDLEFIMRLLAEEGVYFAIHEADGRAIVVFSDDPTGVGEAEPAALPFLQEFGFQGTNDVVFRLTRVHRTRADKTYVRQYDWDKPKVKIEGAAEGSDPGSHVQEVYRYPARCKDEVTAKRYAKILLDSLQADRVLVRGDTGALGLRPGLRVVLEEHPYAPLNGEVLLTEVHIHGTNRREFSLAAQREAGEGYGYVCTFTGIPTARSPYRPPRPTVARTVPGLQTAITTGPAGEEIHVNEHGQVTAQFHWDRLGQKDEKSSAWMRTSQVPLGGSMLLPRMGWEAVVCFDEGDIDVPLVMARFYNGEKPPPYKLPDQKACSSLQTGTTPGGGSSNEIRMNDTAGNEEMFFNGSKDMSIAVGNNATESVGVNQTKTIGANHTLDIGDSLTTAIGANQSLSVGGNQKLGVGTLAVDDVGGSHTLGIGGNRNMMIGGDHRRTVGGSSSETVGANFVNLVMGAVDESTLADMTHTVSAALIELTVGSRSLITPAARSETTGAVKIIAAGGGRGVEASALSRMVGGAVVVVAKGDRTDKAGAALTDTAGGAQITKAANVTFEAQALLSVTMGGASMILSPASVMISGASVKIDAADIDLGMILDN